MGYIDIWSFAETVTRGTENCLLKKYDTKKPNYGNNQNCLNKDVTKFPDFVVIFSGLHFLHFEKYKSRKVSIILVCRHKIPSKLKY